MSDHPDTSFGPSTAVHHLGTCSNMHSMSPDMLGHCPNVVSRSHNHTTCFPCQRRVQVIGHISPMSWTLLAHGQAPPGRSRPWACYPALVLHLGCISCIPRPQGHIQTFRYVPGPQADQSLASLNHRLITQSQFPTSDHIPTATPCFLHATMHPFVWVCDYHAKYQQWPLGCLRRHAWCA